MAEVADSPFARMTLGDCLDDLTVRFLLNLPPGELSSIPRLCFQVEEAQWFYEDFIRPLNPTLPGLHLRDFLLTLFRHCPLLSGFDDTQHLAAYEQFLQYKTRVPVRGAILMNDTMDKVLLVRGWKKGSAWSFPRGKINKDEPDLDCAIREVYEETGFDVKAAGLVEPNQQGGNVKSIDVTMREQHMKLFVFRGVALDTYFEPKTRKEISKIQWYNVKDLPGFKKQKGVAGQGQGEAAATKFYMVAPFLGQLKKWIGQQKRNDSAVLQAQHGRSLSVMDNGFTTAVTEDEGDTEAEGAPNMTAGHVNHSADELKRMLSIGGPAAASPALPEAQQGTQARSLLAMLQGKQPPAISVPLPHTPFEQIDPAFPSQEPEKPHPHHPRDPTVGLQQNVPQFPYSPQHLQHLNQQQAQRNLSMPMQGMAGPPSHFQQSAQPSFAALPPHMQPQHAQFQQRQHSMPNLPPGQNLGPHFNQAGHIQNQHFGAQNGRPLSQGVMQHPPVNMQQPSDPGFPLGSPMHARPESFRSPGYTLDQMLHTGQKPLGSDPSVPEPSKLPAPKLNAHSAKLLDAFKSSTAAKSNAATTRTGISNDQRAGSQHQAALLDLLKKSPAPESAGLSALANAPVTSVAVSTESAEKPEPPPVVQRRPTLNEITRTLPSKPKPKSPTPPIAPAQSSRPQQQQETVAAASEKQPSRSQRMPVTQPVKDVASRDSVSERPKSRGKLFDPANPSTSVRAASSQQRNQETVEQKQPVAILQKPKTNQTSPSLKASPQVKANPVAENGHTAPQFSILQRPGSSAGKARSPVPQSPLRHDSNKSTFQPQVLKRPTSGLGDENTTHPKQEIAPAGPGDDKKVHLLSLFGRTTGAGSTNGSETRVASPPKEARDHDQKSALLGLFNDPAATTMLAKSPEPPAAPQLLPERRPSSQVPQSNSGQNASQQVLLNLFNKPASNNPESPGTPISPFTLGTPISKEPLLKQQQHPFAAPASRSRLSSLATVESNGTASGRQTPTSATPTDQTKGFLLDYLNGVVEREGYRGAKR